MAELYDGKYRVPTARFSRNVYAAGMFHVVICVKDFVFALGKIENAVLRLSDIGKFLYTTIQNLSDHYPDVTIYEYQIMPNHVHILLRIKMDESMSEQELGCTNRLSVVVRGIKANVKRWCNKNDIPFEWQSRYYDSVIWTQEQFANTVLYIQNNVVRWYYDKQNPEAIDAVDD